MQTKPSVTTTAQAIPENLSAIATIIRQDWKKIYFGAVPYLSAMQELSHIGQAYGHDSAATIVRYFLANSSTWRGETAKAVKSKLKHLLQSA